MTVAPPRNFWRDVFALQGSAALHVGWHVLVFGVLAAAVLAASWAYEAETGERLGMEVAPYEVAGAALALLLVLRTNAGYDRWWEGRRLWGGIVNQCRNLATAGLVYGPADPAWRRQFVRWVAAFPHVARRSLRGEPPGPEVAALVGPEAAEKLATAGHMPSAVAVRLAELLRDGCERLGMDRFAFLQADRERAALIDHIGGCERILKAPLPLAYSIKIRQFIALFLLVLPLALLHKLENDWLEPFITMAVAYPLLALDQIGTELQNPFSTRNLGHLPLDDISAGIEKNVLALESETAPGSDAAAARDGEATAVRAAELPR